MCVCVGTLLENADLLPALHHRLQALYLLHDVFKVKSFSSNPFISVFALQLQSAPMLEARKEPLDKPAVTSCEQLFTIQLLRGGIKDLLKFNALQFATEFDPEATHLGAPLSTLVVDVAAMLATQVLRSRLILAIPLLTLLPVLRAHLFTTRP